MLQESDENGLKQQTENVNAFLIYLLHRKKKVLNLHMKHVKKNRDLVENIFLLILKQATEAFTYLRYQNEFQIEETYKIRQTRPLMTSA